MPLHKAQHSPRAHRAPSRNKERRRARSARGVSSSARAPGCWSWLNIGCAQRCRVESCTHRRASRAESPRAPARTRARSCSLTSGKTGKKGGEGGGLTGRNQDVRVPRQRRRLLRRSNPGATSRSLSNEREMKLKTRSSAEYFGAPATHARRPHAVGSSLITPLTYFACRIMSAGCNQTPRTPVI